MKKLLTTASATLLLAGIATQAQASDGSITFNGQVSAVTCTINAGSGGTNGTVTLPIVAKSSLATISATAGTTQFSINLTGCTGLGTAPNNLTKAAAWFENSSDVNSSGRLINTATGGAANVEIALYNLTSSTPIVIGASNGPGTSGAAFPIDANGAATLNYQAKYYATGAAGAGTVTGKVNYTIQYQ